MSLLDQTAEEVIADINHHHQSAIYAINKRAPAEEVYLKWGTFCVESKMELEKMVLDTGMQHLKWMYSYLQNRNQSITIHMETRLGKVKEKKELKKTGIIMVQLIFGLVEPGKPCDLCKRVDDHLLQLSSGKCDIVVGKQIFVSSYPSKFRYNAPKMFIPPKNPVVLDGV